MYFFFQAEDGIGDVAVTGVQTCALPISRRAGSAPVPVEDMGNLDAPQGRAPSPLDALESLTEAFPPGDIAPGGLGTLEEMAGNPVQRPSIWPAVEERVLSLIRDHRSTIVFANSRRLTERLTARLNELAAEQTELTPADAFPAEAVGQS